MTPDLELLVEERAGTDGRVFDLRLSARNPELGLNHRSMGSVNLRAEPSAFFRQYLGEIWKGKPQTAAAWRTFMETIQAKAAFLSEAILPQDLRQLLASLRGEARSLLVQSDDPWIPWEILCLPEDPKSEAADGPFLCEAFAMTRWLRGFPQTLSLPLHRIAVIAPRDSELPQAEGECEDLLRLADGTTRQAARIPAKLADLLESFSQGKYDGWHFTGHGFHRDSAPDLDGIWLEEQEELNPIHLSGKSKKMGLPRPLVFLNACSSGQSGMSLTGIGGWAPHFLKAGAGACIGTLWPIDDQPARDFARAFYASFTTGIPMAEAVFVARQAIRSEGNPTWLAYTAFAHPLAVCGLSTPEARLIAMPSPAGPTNAPPQPPVFVGRDRDLQEVKGRLGAIGKGREVPRIQVLTAVRGWPGVGKSTLAVVLSHDSEVRSAFPGGILWASLGEDPDLLSELAGWGRLLGSQALETAANLKEALVCLKPLLRNQRTLLVLDDVWDPAHALPMQSVLGEGSAVLLTTRQAGVAQTLSTPQSSIYNLQVLDEPAALELLQALAPEVIERYPEECAELARDLEYLPLALHVAGRVMHAEFQMGWDMRDFIQHLSGGPSFLQKLAPVDRADSENLVIPTVEALLRRSTDRLDPLTRERFRFLGGFAAKPATFSLESLRLAWNVEDPRPTVRKLVDLGLLEPAGDERFQMHSVLAWHASSLEP